MIMNAATSSAATGTTQDAFMVITDGTNTATTGGTGTVWQIWNTNSGMATGSNTGTGLIWLTWNTNSIATVNGTSTDPVWLLWSTNTIGIQSTAVAVDILVPRPRDPAEIQKEQEEAREAERLRKEREEAHKAAQKRAMELLYSYLRPEQIATIDKNGWFVVEGGKSKKQYRIKVDHYAGNIFELNDGKEVARYCVHANNQIPLGDHLLAQTIGLRFDEDHIIGLANKRTLVA
jgi:hypothetical protein